MRALDHLRWPFFEERHRAFAATLETWAAHEVRDVHGADVDAMCRHLVGQLGGAGWLRHAVGGIEHGGTADVIDTRMLCLAREILARHNGLADFAFAMQGLGSGAISLAGSAEQRAHWLPCVSRGEAIAAFALSEPEAGSDVGAMQCTARIDGVHAVLDGEKTWISNGGIADFYVVFARSGEAPGSRGISAFIVEAGTPGFEIAERIDVIAPHPLAKLRFTNCRVPLANRIGGGGEGFKLAMRTLDVFRTSVAAAALGFARRALEEGLARATSRKMFGQGEGVTAQAAMAKLAATEGAQQVIDAALQLFGGLGVVSGQPVERLYREIRSLRIYEGATEVQQLIIGKAVLRSMS
jgi:acyl-CoA dehydrogenase